MDNKDVLKKNWIIDLIKDAGFGCMATTEGNQPRLRPMMPHLADDGTLLLAVLGRARTINQIKENPRVEICYIDRKMWYARITGKAKVSNDPAKKEIAWSNIPMLRQYFSGTADPNFVLIEVDTAKVEAMSPHQKNPETFSLKP